MEHKSQGKVCHQLGNVIYTYHQFYILFGLIVPHRACVIHAESPT